MKVFYLLLTALIFSSCREIDFGYDGVVVDNETGLRIADVTVKMETSSSENVEDVTDSVGYFDTRRTSKCGYECFDDYFVTFSKPGYDTLVIRANYKKTAEFIEGTYKDTMMVKLQPVP